MNAHCVDHQACCREGKQRRILACIGRTRVSYSAIQRWKLEVEAADVGDHSDADTYHQFLDTEFMQGIIDSGQDGSYLLPTGAYIHLGYEIMAMFGPTRSHLTS